MRKMLGAFAMLFGALLLFAVSAPAQTSRHTSVSGTRNNPQERRLGRRRARLVDHEPAVRVARGFGRGGNRLTAAVVIRPHGASEVDDPTPVPGKHPDWTGLTHLEPSLEADTVASRLSGRSCSPVASPIQRGSVEG